MSRYGSNLALNAPSTGSRFGGKLQRSRLRREPSGVFTLFQPAQVQQFREAFSLIDQDGDGVISEEDLKRIFASLGMPASRDKLSELLSSRPGGHTDKSGEGVNFMEFLTMMGEHLFEFDGEAELIEAFESFDEGDTGFVKSDEMRRWLSEVGERMEPEEVDRFLKGPFTDRQGNFNYREWVKVLRINADDDQQPQQQKPQLQH